MATRARGLLTHRHVLHRALAVAVLASAPSIGTSQNEESALPARLEHYLATVVRPTPAERRRFMEGAPLTKLLEADPSREVAVFAAVWINAPVRRYVEAVQDIETFERGGGFKVTRRISAPPRLEDFAALHLSEEDVADLRTCRIGDCHVKLGEQALGRFRTEVDWRASNSHDAVDAVMRQIAHEYVSGYLEGGNERLAVYQDKPRPTFVAREFESLVDRMPPLASDMPDLRRYLLDYPRATLPQSHSFLYWQETQFGLKPTIRISHLVIREGADDTVVASKMLYASHYFWTALELRALLPDPSHGTGFWLVTVNRSRSDGLSGFFGRLVRGRVRSEVQKGALATIMGTKTRLERP